MWYEIAVPNTPINPETQFIHRKLDHLKLALLDEMQAAEAASLSQVNLIHDSLPELNLNEVSIESGFKDEILATPFFIPGMTGGHEQAEKINSTLAEQASDHGWLMGVGSQRRELDDAAFEDSVNANLTQRFPKLKLIANLGISQLITIHQQKNWSQLQKVIERMNPALIAIHLNPLQEAVQPEGTPQYKGALQALKIWTSLSPVPVVVKETGSGMSVSTLKKLSDLKLFAVDVSGLGGTHWGRIEGKRAAEASVHQALGETFKNWGVSTVDSIKNSNAVIRKPTEIWASGGVRSGLDAAKLLALGAHRIGFAKPALEAALQGSDRLDHWMRTCEQELRVALFCTGSSTIDELNSTKVQTMDKRYG